MDRTMGADAAMKYLTIINNQQFEIEIEKDGSVTVNGEHRPVDFLALDDSLFSVIMNATSHQVVIDEEMGQYSVMMGGRMYEGQVLDQRALLLAQRRGGLGGGSGEINSPMPGLIVTIPVEVDQQVEQGQTVVILESMKMQNELKSPIAGVVKSINVEAGQSVEKNALLVTIEAPEE